MMRRLNLCLSLIEAVNPNIKEKVIPKSEELIQIIEESQIKINEGLRKLKEIT